jgi:predicted dehydrogenase
MKISRRKMLKTSAVTALGFPFIAKGGEQISANERVNVALIGVGGIHKKKAMGEGPIAGHNIVAFADVDDKLSAKVYAKNPGVPTFRDYRKMFDKMGNSIDAVMIGTPDHSHFPAMMSAIAHDCHLFCQKPLTQNLWECAEIKKLVQKTELITQMGNQGHAFEQLLRGVEWIKSGLIGDVREVHLWTNRAGNGMQQLPAAEPVPNHLSWDVWLGTMPHYDYSRKYAPKRWRWWSPFGTGALGDIGCHTMDLPKWALDLDVPDKVSAETSGVPEAGTPKQSTITYEFGARGKLPPVKMVWYDGGRMPPVPADMEEGRKLSTEGGAIFYGSKHTLYVPGMRPSSLQILPYAKMQDMKRNGEFPEPWLPRVKDGIDGEWFKAIQTGKQPSSNFADYACDLTEMVHLGNLAIRSGETIRWNREEQSAKGLSNIAHLIHPPRNNHFLI